MEQQHLARMNKLAGELRESVPTDLKPCPACGKTNGELVKGDVSRFPYSVQCRACGWATDFVKLPGIAVKLWNEAKRKGKPK